MQCSRFASIAPRMRALPRMAGSWLALGLTLGFPGMGCRFEPSSQAPDDNGPGPAVDAAQPADGRQPIDAGSAGPPDAMREPDAGQAGKPTLPAYPVENGDIEIDGELDDWSDEGWQTITAPGSYVKDQNQDSADARDISMRFAARWHPTAGLYLAFEVTDDVHAIDNGNNDLLWRGDSIQTGFDLGRNGGNAYDTIDDYEYGWALASNDQEREHRWVQGNGAPGPSTEVGIVRDEDTDITTYEIRMPPSNLGLGSLAANQRMGFSAVANEDDADIDIGDLIRDGWLEWTPGIAGSKTPGLFGVLELR